MKMNKTKEIDKMLNKMLENDYGVEMKFYPDRMVNISVFAPEKNKSIIRTEIVSKYLFKEDMYEFMLVLYNDIFYPDRTEDIELDLEQDVIDKIQEMSDELNIPFNDYLVTILEEYLKQEKYVKTECPMRRRMFRHGW